MKKIPKIIENVEILKKLKHPNLLQYFSVWYEENNHKAIIITELLQGGNLNEHRKYQKKLKIKLIKKWIKQILLALNYLHSNGYIHHDIKCQNILVDRITGNLKIGDLISLEKCDEKGYFSKYIGSEEFIAPEVKQGKYTFKADIYSLGLTIVQLVTMEKPYKEFRKKENIYEAKINGKLPLSFNHINNKDLQNFISLCVKEEKNRPNCKELLENKWLNDTTSKENNLCVEIINNLRQVNFLIDKKTKFKSNKGNNEILDNKDKYPYNLLSPFTSSNSLINTKIKKQSSMGPIYSLDISKLNLTKVDKDKNNNLNKYKLNSFILKKSKINQSFKGIRLNFSSLNLNEQKNIESSNPFSDRITNNRKYQNKKSLSKFVLRESNDSSEFLKQENKNAVKSDFSRNNNYNIVYCYIFEYEEKLIFTIKEKQENIENTLLLIKIVVNNRKFKQKKLLEKDITITNKFKSENTDIIINVLMEIISLNLDDVLLIKNKLGEKIKKIIKDKKLRDLNDKINQLIRNFEFLLNNEEFDYLECLINSKDFCESKLPNDIIKKIDYYKEKKIYIEDLFSSHNITDGEDYNNNYNINFQDLLILNIND